MFNKILQYFNHNVFVCEQNCTKNIFYLIFKYNLNLYKYLDLSYLNVSSCITLKFVNDDLIYYVSINSDDFICIHDKNINLVYNGFGIKFEYVLKNLIDFQ